MKRVASIIGFAAVGLVSGGVRAQSEGLSEKARRLGREAATELTGEDAVPFVSPERARREARREHPTARIDEVSIPVGDVELTGWFVTPTRGVEEAGFVLALPGWQSHAGFGLGQTVFLLDHGYRVMILEDRAHAWIGRASEFEGFIREDVRDVERALDHLASTRNLTGVPVILYGFSWGGLKAILTASGRTDVDAVVIDGSVPGPLYLARQRFEEYMPPSARDDEALYAEFTEAFDAAVKERLGYAPSTIDVEAAVADISPRPLLILHGRDDDFVPLSVAEELFAAAKEPKKLVAGDRFGHCLGMRRQPDVYVPAVVDFLDRVVAARR